jgi:hypothetical protein
MSDSNVSRDPMPLEKARKLADLYLRNRYYDFEKIQFSGHEIVATGDTTIYRLHGKIRVKSRSLLDNIGFHRMENTYKFVLDIDGLTGKTINYEFR